MVLTLEGAWLRTSLVFPLYGAALLHVLGGGLEMGSDWVSAWMVGMGRVMRQGLAPVEATCLPVLLRCLLAWGYAHPGKGLREGQAMWNSF